MTDPLKEAFTKVRQDIDYLYSELEEIKQLLHELKFSVSLQPTNQQSIQHPPISTPTQAISSVNTRISDLHRVSEILGTLDDLKKEVRLKFKRLTEQEMLIFSTIYQLEDQGFMVDYSILAQKTNLTEISIRDYVRKILYKQIPLVKSKELNKKVILSIPQDLKRIASLSTINQLRAL